MFLLLGDCFSQQEAALESKSGIFHTLAWMMRKHLQILAWNKEGQAEKADLPAHQGCPSVVRAAQDHKFTRSEWYKGRQKVAMDTPGLLGHGQVVFHVSSLISSPLPFRASGSVVQYW